MDEILAQPPNAQFAGTVEEHPEYKLVVQSNRLMVDIDNEVAVIHKAWTPLARHRRARRAQPRLTPSWEEGGWRRRRWRACHQFARDHYAPKFPELESLVLVPLEYMHVVKAIGNETVRVPPPRPRRQSVRANSAQCLIRMYDGALCATPTRFSPPPLSFLLNRT